VFDPNAEPPSPLSRRLPAWLATGNVHEWTKTVAVVVAALWGVYTFVWKDILVPSWAPASLVIEVKSRQEGPAARPEAGGKGPARLRLRVIATNPSSRTLYLLPNVWWASVIEDKNKNKNKDKEKRAMPISFESMANDVLRQPSVRQAERGRAEDSYEMLATGGLFIDNQILPGETLSRDLSIALPKENTAVTFQLLVLALTRNPINASGSSLLFKDKQMGWSYINHQVLPVMCSNSTHEDGKLTCSDSVDIKAIGQEMIQFDSKASIFHKSAIFLD
jgi:hypothetical protein